RDGVEIELCRDPFFLALPDPLKKLEVPLDVALVLHLNLELLLNGRVNAPTFEPHGTKGSPVHFGPPQKSFSRNPVFQTTKTPSFEPIACRSDRHKERGSETFLPDFNSFAARHNLIIQCVRQESDRMPLGAQPQIRVVFPQMEPVLRSGSEHPVGF